MRNRRSDNPVRLRRKPLANGDESLYLDIYANGKRSYEFLDLRLRKGKENKEENERILALAEKVRQKKNETVKESCKIEDCPTQQMNILKYLTEHYERESPREANHLKKFVPKNARVCDIDKKLDAEVWDNINKADLKESTKHTYYAMFKAFKNKLVKEDLIADYKTNKSFKNPQAERKFLTIEEVRRVANTDTSGDERLTEVKRAFLFSCLSGLRISDIKKLKWAEVSEIDGYTRITFRQKKVRRLEYIDLTKDASVLMGERRSDEQNVFTIESEFEVSINRYVKKLMKLSGITKHITFHCARHTFAVMMLDLGADLYTVSKLLGHSNIGVTQIYAKVLDKNKRAAVDMIPSLLQG